MDRKGKNWGTKAVYVRLYCPCMVDGEENYKGIVSWYKGEYRVLSAEEVRQLKTEHKCRERKGQGQSQRVRAARHPGMRRSKGD